VVGYSAASSEGGKDAAISKYTAGIGVCGSDRHGLFCLCGALYRAAEMTANTLAQATLERAREADTADNAAACTEALSVLKGRYGLQ